MAIAAVFGLSACTQLPRVNATASKPADSSDPGSVVVSPRNTLASAATTLGGLAVGPSELAKTNAIVGNNAAGIVGNNAAGIVGNNAAGVVANNAAGYRTLGLESESAIQDALVYLTDPEDRFYKVGGEFVETHTDATGKYSFKTGIPVGMSVIVNVLLAKDQREVGYTVPRSGGDNKVDISLATTFVTEYLRFRAGQAGKDMSYYDLAALPDLTERTERALAASELATPSLYIGEIGTMNNSYALAVERDVQGLREPWRKLLGNRLLVGWSIAGNGLMGSPKKNIPGRDAELTVPKGLTMDKEGNLYIVEETGHRVNKIDRDGKITTVAGTFLGAYEPAAANGSKLGNKTPLNWPRCAAIGPDGNLYIGDIFNQRIRVVVLKPNPDAFGLNLAATGSIYDVVGDPGSGVGQAPNGYNVTPAPALQGTKLAGVRGITFDSDGNMIFTDTWGWSDTVRATESAPIWHHIRILCNKPGRKYGVTMGTRGHVYSIAGKDFDFGFAGDEKRLAAGAPIDYAQSIITDSQDNLYFSEANNNRIRKIDKDGYLLTVAGGGACVSDKCSSPSTGDNGPALQASLGAPYGMALDEVRQLLFISEKGVNRVRVVDLKTGTITPLIGASTGTFGGTTGDGIASRLFLSQPHDLLLDAAGNLYVTSSRAHKVYKFLADFIGK
jgi:sugar lactone lactonase YvrE